MMRRWLLLCVLMLVVLVGCKEHAATEPDSGEPTDEAPLALGTCEPATQLDTDLTAAGQADVIPLSGTNPINCPAITMAETWSGGVYVFSDSPESPSTKGKLYEDGGLAATSGTTYNRIFAYHVNGKASGNMRFTVLVKNTGSAAATLTVQKKGTSGPTTSYLYAGKLAFQRWLDSTAGTGVSVGAGSTVRLDSTFDSTNVAPSNLLHGIWDYSFPTAHKVTICALDQNDNPTSVCPGLSVLSRDTHQRGTFPNADKVYDTGSGVTIDTNDGIQSFPIAGGTTNDTNAVGTDATDSSTQTLTGNFGILYRMHLTTASSDGRKLGFLINPRGGQWGGAVWAVAGELAGGKFLIPAGSASTGDNTKGAVEGKYDPASVAVPWVQLMPTGGSSFPVRFVAVPY